MVSQMMPMLKMWARWMRTFSSRTQICSKLIRSKNFRWRIPRTKVAILSTTAREMMIKVLGKVSEDIMSSLKFIQSSKLGGQQFQFQPCHQRRQSVTKISSSLMRGDSISRGSWRNWPLLTSSLIRLSSRILPGHRVILISCSLPCQKWLGHKLSIEWRRVSKLKSTCTTWFRKTNLIKNAKSFRISLAKLCHWWRRCRRRSLFICKTKVWEFTTINSCWPWWTSTKSST